MGILPTEPTKANKVLSDQIMLVYGRPKIGKSTFCSQFEDAIFLATEPGLRSLEVSRVNVTTWAQFLEACRELAEGKHGYKTIIIDTVDRLVDVCQAYIEEQEQVSFIGQIPHGRGYSMARREFSEVLNKLASLPYGLIFVSHADQVEIETKTSKYNRWTISAGTDKDNRIVLNLMDIILFMDSEIRREEEIGVMHTKPSVYYNAGDKSKILPNDIEFPLDQPEQAYKIIEQCFKKEAK